MALRAVWQAGSAFVVACLVGAPGIGVPLSVAVAVCGLASFGVRRAMPVWPPVTALPAFGWQQTMAGVGGAYAAAAVFAFFFSLFWACLNALSLSPIILQMSSFSLFR